MKIIMLPLIATLALPAIAFADPKADASGKSDQNKMVCRTEKVTGSRLGAKRRCLTAYEWAEQARLDRQSVERTQMNRYNGNESLSGGVQGDFGRNN